MSRHWYIIANQQNIKLYNERIKGDKMSLITEFYNPLARERNRTLIRKQAGIQTKNIGYTGRVRYSIKQRNNPHEEASAQFAKELSRFLERKRQTNEYDSLIIVAEPHFLGKIRSSLNIKVKRKVEQWIRKDLLKVPKSQLSSHMGREFRI